MHVHALSRRCSRAFSSSATSASGRVRRSSARSAGGSRRTSSSGTAGASGPRRRRFRCCCSVCGGWRAAPGLRAIGRDGRRALALALRRPPGVLLPLRGGRRRLLPLGARGRRAPPTTARDRDGASAPARLALLLCGPQLFPLLEAIPHSAEYRARRRAVGGGSAAGSRSRSAPRRPAAARRPAVRARHLRKEPASRPNAQRRVRACRIGYAGAVLFPLAGLAFAARPARPRPRRCSSAFSLAGLAYGASFPGVMDLTARLPGFALALNYRLVFLAGPRPRGPRGVRNASRLETRRRRARARAGRARACAPGALRPVPDRAAGLRVEGSAPAFTWTRARLRGRAARRARAGRGGEDAPALARGCRPPSCCSSGSGSLEMRGTYPTLPASTLAPRLPTLAALPIGGEPGAHRRAGATSSGPNAAALYGVEDVRGYESLVLDRFADTFPLWSTRPAGVVQPRGRPRVGAPLPVPSERAVRDRRSRRPGAGGMAASRRAVPSSRSSPTRAPCRGRSCRARCGACPMPAARLAAMAASTDFGGTAFLAGPGPAAAGQRRGGAPPARLGPGSRRRGVRRLARLRRDVAAGLAGLDRRDRTGAPLPLETVNHAFVGFWLEPGRHDVRLTYRPASWALGLASFSAGSVVCIALALAAARRRPA